jgi:hypothetical protein
MSSISPEQALCLLWGDRGILPGHPRASTRVGPVTDTIADVPLARNGMIAASGLCANGSSAEPGSAAAFRRFSGVQFLGPATGGIRPTRAELLIRCPAKQRRGDSIAPLSSREGRQDVLIDPEEVLRIVLPFH